MRIAATILLIQTFFKIHCLQLFIYSAA